MARLALLLCLGLLSGVAGSVLQAQLSTASEAREKALVASWSNDLEAGHKSPIKRVVGLLQKMKAELDNEANNEAAMYDKMVCWCQTNEKEKTKAIADAEALDSELSSEIEARAAKFGEQATEIARMKTQIAEDTEALKKATAIREKQASKFSSSEKDLMQSVTNVKNAIEVLSKHHSGASLVQLDTALMASMRAVLRDLSYKHEMLMVGDEMRTGKKVSFLSLAATSKQGMSAEDNSLLEALNAEGATASGALPLNIALKIVERSAKGAGKVGGGFLQADLAPTSGSYAPQSSQIFGILTTLKDDFEANLSQEQKEERQAAEDFQGMSAAKTSQIAAGKEKLDSIEGEHADNQKGLSDAKETLEMTREQRSADVKFLQNLKMTCMGLDKQWAERSKTRGAETKAVSEAIAIITADDNMDLLRQTVSLLQVDSNADSQEGTAARLVRSRVVASLRKAAEDPLFNTDDLFNAWHSRSAPLLGSSSSPRTQLSTLAVTASLDAFTKIKKMMDTMSADLKEEQSEEVKFKANCEKNFDNTEKELFVKNEQKDDLQTNIEKLAKMMTTLEEEIAAAKAQTADTEVAIQKASQVREGENAEFQSTVADQRATQEILKKALGKLKEFYKKAALLQKSKHQQEPPVKFNAYKTNAGASPVIGLIEQIIEDSAALENEAVAGETGAQKSYESFVKDSNDLIANLNDSVSMKTKSKSTARMDSETAKSDLESTNGELDGLAQYEADLHSQCDFVLKNFAIRQKARLDEMEAIQQAKAILSGSQ